MIMVTTLITLSMLKVLLERRRRSGVEGPAMRPGIHEIR